MQYWISIIKSADDTDVIGWITISDEKVDLKEVEVLWLKDNNFHLKISTWESTLCRICQWASHLERKVHLRQFGKFSAAPKDLPSGCGRHRNSRYYQLVWELPSTGLQIPHRFALCTQAGGRTPERVRLGRILTTPSSTQRLIQNILSLSVFYDVACSNNTNSFTFCL